jgi:hypothetical protein
MKKKYSTDVYLAKLCVQQQANWPNECACKSKTHHVNELHAAEFEQSSWHPAASGAVPSIMTQAGAFPLVPPAPTTRLTGVGHASNAGGAAIAAAAVLLRATSPVTKAATKAVVGTITCLIVAVMCPALCLMCTCEIFVSCLHTVLRVYILNTNY